MSGTHERVAAFAAWSEPDGPLGRLLGRGKYGAVYAVRGAAVKVQRVEGPLADRSSPQWRRLRQAYREHVLGVVQSLLVANRVTPHVVMHFGAQLRPGPHACDVRMYMEAFDGSLDGKGAAELLTDDRSFRGMALQVTQGLAALAECLRLVHNDLYPRNILYRRTPARDADYQVCGRSYWLRGSCALYAITDFGLAGTPLLQSQEGNYPDMRPPQVDVGTPFGTLSAPRHVLCYRKLPPFSRDLYALFRSVARPFSGSPVPPAETRRWAAGVLRALDSGVPDTSGPEGVAEVLELAFGGAPAAPAAPEEERFCVRRGGHAALIREAAAVVRRVPFAPMAAGRDEPEQRGRRGGECGVPAEVSGSP